MSIMNELLDTAVGEFHDTWANIGQVSSGWADHMARYGVPEATDFSAQYDGQGTAPANKKPAPKANFGLGA